MKMFNELQGRSMTSPVQNEKMFRRMASPEGRGCREAAGEGCRSNDFTPHPAIYFVLRTLSLRERPFAENWFPIPLMG